MKKRSNALKVTKETVRNLTAPAREADLFAAVGGSCTTMAATTPGGSHQSCCV